MKDFIIDHIDPLGQGVFKEGEDIFFIPKTLPGESGKFKIIHRKKGVHFGQVIEIAQKSPQRITPLCEHYQDCNGCHYQHTNYQDEIEFKEQSFLKLISRLTSEKIEVKHIKNEERFAYRNRIQLHYDLKEKVIGFKKSRSKKILPIKNCLLASKPIQERVAKLLHNNAWTMEAQKFNQKQGHIELYERNNEVSIHWNKPYAQGGFTQVNSQVNLLFQDYIKDQFNHKNNRILDLFGGSGNLVNNLISVEKLSVDLYSSPPKDSRFLHLDLFNESALSLFKQQIKKEFNTIFIDPPRSGFKAIDSWIEEFSPENILYVSCHPATMIRDLEKITQDYKIKEVLMIDFFPNTYHFEGAIYLNKIIN